MDTINEESKKEMLYFAHRALFFNEQIIKICDNWLPTEQANANMIREIEERRKKEKQEQLKLQKQEKHGKWSKWLKWGKSAIKN
jgi:hypothetical protein